MEAGAPFEAVLFDLDGTLIDSIGLIVRSYQHTLTVHGKPAETYAEILRGVGAPLATHLDQWASDAQERAAMVATYRAWNRAHHDELVRPFPGIAAALDGLVQRGRRIAVVTSKLRAAALHGLAHCGLHHPFEVVLGADDVERHKPDPAPILLALERMGVAPARAAYVGDSVFDVRAANAAGVVSGAALWGPYERAFLAPAAPRVWLEAPAELARL
jgi:pyrophosphatase PpaX